MMIIGMAPTQQEPLWLNDQVHARKVQQWKTVDRGWPLLEACFLHSGTRPDRIEECRCKTS